MNPNRRKFLASAGVTMLGAAAVSRVGAASLPEAPMMDKASTQPPLAAPNGRPYNPVVTLNGWTLPWRMNNGVKEFHLVAEPVVRELAPGMKANLWGYNGQSPGPTIEVVEGDRVRIFVTNKLPEHTTIHWHGQRSAQRHGRRRRPQSAADSGGQNLRVRVRRQAPRNLHVPPARRRDGADGDGDDGLLGHASEGSEVHAGGPRLRVSVERLRHRAGRSHAEDHDDARFQPLQFQQPGLPRHRPDRRCATTSARASASAT